MEKHESNVCMTDDELDHILGLPPGYFASAPAKVQACMESFRTSAIALSSEMEAELLYGKAGAERARGILTQSQAPKNDQ